MNLFFDVETTGVNTRKDNLVQLAWILTDVDGKIIQEADHIIEPDGFTIPNRAAEVHGITTDQAQALGIKLDEALDEFSSAAKAAKNIIAHNISFDHDVLETEFGRCGMNFPLLGKTQICTMRLSVNWCRLPKLNGMKGFKRPRLDELYYKLFGEGFENAHDALSDTRACMRCYYKLVELHVISPPEPNTPHQTRPEQKVDADHNYQKGYLAGYKEGHKVGAQEGYDEIYDEAYGEGYETGYEEALQESDGALLKGHQNAAINSAAICIPEISIISLHAIFIHWLEEYEFISIMHDHGVEDESETFDYFEDPTPENLNLLFKYFHNSSEINEEESYKTLFNAYGAYVSSYLIAKLLVEEKLPDCIKNDCLFEFHHRFITNADTHSRMVTSIIRSDPKFNLPSYQRLLDSIFDKILDETKDFGYLKSVLSDPSCPTAMFDCIQDMDFNYQYEMLRSPNITVSHVRSLITEFYARLKSRDLTSATAINYLNGSFDKITDHEQDVLKIHKILTNDKICSRDMVEFSFETIRANDIKVSCY